MYITVEMHSVIEVGLLKIPTINTSVTDPNKTYSFVVVKRQYSESGLE